MVRERMMPVAHADVAVAAIRALVREHERADARHVALKREHHHVAHQPRVLLVAFGNALRHFVSGGDRRIRARHHFLRFLDALFDLADRGEILIQLLLVAAADFRAQRFRVVEHEVEDALFVKGAPFGDFALLLRQLVGKEPLEDEPRIDLARHRRRFVAPRNVIRIRARIAGVALAALPAWLEPELERAEARLPARGVRGHLVRGNADANLRALALERLRASEPASRRARVVASAVRVRAALVLRETAEHEQLVFVRLERLQNIRQIEVCAVRGRRPVRHVRAVRDEKKRHACGRLFCDRAGERLHRDHCIEHRQRDRGAEAAEKRAAWDGECGVHDVG